MAAYSLDKKPDKAAFMAEAEKYFTKFGKHSKFPSIEAYFKFMEDTYDLTISPMSDSQWKMYSETKNKQVLEYLRKTEEYLENSLKEKRGDNLK